MKLLGKYKISHTGCVLVFNCACLKDWCLSFEILCSSCLWLHDWFCLQAKTEIAIDSTHYHFVHLYCCILCQYPLYINTLVCVRTCACVCAYVRACVCVCVVLVYMRYTGYIMSGCCCAYRVGKRKIKSVKRRKVLFHQVKDLPATKVFKEEPVSSKNSSLL